LLLGGCETTGVFFLARHLWMESTMRMEALLCPETSSVISFTQLLADAIKLSKLFIHTVWLLEVNT